MNVSRIRLSPIHLSTRLSTLSTYLSYLSNYPSICASIYNVIWLMVNGILAHVASGSFLPPPAPLLDFFGGVWVPSQFEKKNPSRVFLCFCFWDLTFSLLLLLPLDLMLLTGLKIRSNRMELNGIESGSVGGWNGLID